MSYPGWPLPDSEMKAAADDPLRPVVKQLLLERRRTMTVPQIFDALVKMAALPDSRSARLYPTDPVRVRLSCIVASLYHAGELGGMDAPAEGDAA